ncbi:MAG: ferredoxin [Candidatus Aenigmarchaeota archaeon]|nr:ferredoxin [Candidatus Aenigmarchaeota archaeon]
MGKYKIVYDRDACIGAASCVAVEPNFWSLDKENKAILADSKKESSNIFTREIEEKDLNSNLDAAKSCPVNCIHIIEKDAKKQIV